MLVKAMGSLHSEDFEEEQYGSLVKRSRSTIPPFDQLRSSNHTFLAPSSQYNPLDEPSPLGLRLRKSPSLLDLIQMRLSQGDNVGISVALRQAADSGSKSIVRGFSVSSSVHEKLKASNFRALLLRIGSWEYVSRYEGDLVVKCYFAKHKLVWEVLEGGLKRKIEIQWSDITALKAECPDNGPDNLTVTLARRPSFFRETNPQPRKHTLWQATADFTDGQASLNKIHFLEFPGGVLKKHYEKLIQCDTRLSVLSRQPGMDVGSPYFDPEEESARFKSSNQLPDASRGSPVSVFEDAAAAQLSTFKFEHKHGLTPESAVVSPSSVMDTRTSDEHEYGRCENSESHKIPSASMSHLVNDLEDHISKKLILGNLEASECQSMLDNIAQILLNDTATQCSAGLDELSLMKKVNSLCNLLEGPTCEARDHRGPTPAEDVVSEPDEVAMETSEEGSVEPDPTMPRQDSLGDLLLHPPWIASLPKLPKFLLGRGGNIRMGGIDYK